MSMMQHDGPRGLGHADHDEENDEEDDEKHTDIYFSGPHVCLFCGWARLGRLSSPLLRRAEERRRAEGS